MWCQSRQTPIGRCDCLMSPRPCCMASVLPMLLVPPVPSFVLARSRRSPTFLFTAGRTWDHARRPDTRGSNGAKPRVKINDACHKFSTTGAVTNARDPTHIHSSINLLVQDRMLNSGLSFRVYWRLTAYGSPNPHLYLHVEMFEKCSNKTACLGYSSNCFPVRLGSFTLLPIKRENSCCQTTTGSALYNVLVPFPSNSILS